MGIRLPALPPPPPDPAVALASVTDRFEHHVRTADLLATRRLALQALLRNDLAARRLAWRTLQLAAGAAAWFAGLLAWGEWRRRGGDFDADLVAVLPVAGVLAAGLAAAVQALAFRRGRGDLGGPLRAWALLAEHPDLQPLLSERRFQPVRIRLRRTMWGLVSLPLLPLGGFLLAGSVVFHDPGRAEDPGALVLSVGIASLGALLLAVGVLCLRKALRLGRLLWPGDDPPPPRSEPRFVVRVGLLDVAVVFVLAAATAAAASRLLGEAAWLAAMPAALALLIVVLRAGARWWYPVLACTAGIGMFLAGAAYEQQRVLHERGEWTRGIVAVNDSAWNGVESCAVAALDTGETIGRVGGCEDVHAGERLRVLADPRGEVAPSRHPPTPHLHREAFAGGALAFTASLTIGTLTRRRASPPR
jgi:hypothetical protein